MQFVTTELQELAAAYLKKHNYDSSHDINHARRVAEYAYMVIEKGKYQETIPIPLTIISAFLHDLVDKKYVSSGDELVASLRDLFAPAEMTIILLIIDNISFSKRAARRARGLPMIDIAGVISESSTIGVTLFVALQIQLMAEIVCDADMLDAYDAQRCIDYGVNRLKLSADVLDHHVKKILCDRVLKYKDEYFNTAAAREICLPMHAALVEYVAKHYGSV